MVNLTNSYSQRYKNTAINIDDEISLKSFRYFGSEFWERDIKEIENFFEFIGYTPKEGLNICYTEIKNIQLNRVVYSTETKELLSEWHGNMILTKREDYQREDSTKIKFYSNLLKKHQLTEEEFEGMLNKEFNKLLRPDEEYKTEGE